MRGCAVRASLYGLRVAMIDLDQQANLTRACRIDTNKIVTMIDVITNNITLNDHMAPVADGLDLFPSKFESAVLSTTFNKKRTLLINTFPLDRVFKDLIDPLRENYDLIFIDCPPDLDAIVTAAVLAADFVWAPVEPDEFSIGGFHLTNMELKKYLLVNKYDNRTFLSHKTLSGLMNDKETRALLFKSFIPDLSSFADQHRRPQSHSISQ
jgi:chromosome partitioning protein